MRPNARNGAAALLAAAVLLVAVPPLAAAKDIVVGGAIGWGLGAPTTPARYAMRVACQRSNAKRC